MSSRTRSRAKTVDSSTKTHPSGATNNFVYFSYKEDMNDTTGSKLDEHVMDKTLVKREFAGLGGDSRSTVSDTTYADLDGHYWPTYIATSPCNHLAHSGLPSDNQIAIKTLSSSNPSRPRIDVPLFIYELREIPEMLHYLASYIKRTGNALPFDTIADAGGLVLTAEYGIKPLVSDIQKFLNFANLVGHKVKDIKKLASQGGIHAKVVWGRSKTDDGTRYSYTNGETIVDTFTGFTLRAKFLRVSAFKMWGTTRWTPDPQHPLPVTDFDILGLAIKATFGIDFSIDTVYNAIPWSWLLDWASNTGDYISTFRNTVPAKHSKVCVMRHTITSEEGKITQLGPFMKGAVDYRILRETKTRVVMPFVLPELELPLLTARQLSILGSLAVQRIPRDTMRYVILQETGGSGD